MISKQGILGSFFGSGKELTIVLVLLFRVIKSSVVGIILYIIAINLLHGCHIIPNRRKVSVNNKPNEIQLILD